MNVVGCDPGVTGAFALLIDGTLADLRDMPCNDSRVDGSHVAAIFAEWSPDVVVVENTQPMPKNGSVPSFKLGLNTGIVLGVAQALQHPLVRIRPIDWKRANGLVGKSKDASRGLAAELWPRFVSSFHLKKYDGRAEAALIARAHITRLIHERSAS